jgi:phospholipase/carboxylesterase
MGVFRAGNITKPTSLVILLHGYGANGQDLLGLADDWAPELPGTAFVAPDAPEQCEMSPFGYQWFGLRDWSPVSMTSGAESIAPWLNEFVDAEMKLNNVPASRVVLCGFSQGTMMSLYIALRRPEKIAGVLGYSGALLGAEQWQKNQVQKTDICLVHGVADTVVPVTAYYHASQMLQQHDIPVEGHVLPGLMHGINEYGLQIGLKFLKRVLA